MRQTQDGPVDAGVRGRPPSRRGAQVVDKLLAAAERQLELGGLEQTTERTIAAEAGVSLAQLRGVSLRTKSAPIAGFEAPRAPE